LEEIIFSDTNKSGSTFAGALKLSETTAEWDDYETAFGEVSLMNAVVQANVSGASKYYVNISGEDGKSFRSIDIDNQTKERLDTLREGSVRESIDRDISTLDRGTQITPNAMLNSVITKDRVINDRISDAATTAQREQEVVQQNMAFAEGLSEIMSRKGRLVGYSEVSGKGHLDLKGGLELFGTGGSVGAGANVNLGRRNMEEENFDLYYGMASRITAMHPIDQRKT